MWEAVLKQQQAAGYVPDCHGTSPINPPPPHSHRPQPLLPPFLPPKLNDRDEAEGGELGYNSHRGMGDGKGAGTGGPGLKREPGSHNSLCQSQRAVTTAGPAAAVNNDLQGLTAELRLSQPSAPPF
ncbi:hypothetical protein NQZ68_015975 [Dissostichus eleginoides]|nr:hypothetical protein NQZ68_015975 [Dissostichus eleginoides]